MMLGGRLCSITKYVHYIQYRDGNQPAGSLHDEQPRPFLSDQVEAVRKSGTPKREYHQGVELAVSSEAKPR